MYYAKSVYSKTKVKSTFFLVGDWVKNYPDSVKDIAKHGHDVGNHSNTHPHMTQMSSSDMVGQIQSCNEKIKELTGKTPVEYLNSYRVERACRKLLGSDLSITQIAYGSGFNDLSYFIKTFKKIKGSSPSIYRKTIT